MSEPVPYLDLRAQLKPLRAETGCCDCPHPGQLSFCLGPDVTQFEQDFAKFCGAEHALGFNSGTSALHVAMRLLDVGPGDEVITTPYTFIATSWAISYCGAKPVYVDIDDATFKSESQADGKAITPRTKAVLPVHLYGQPFDVEAVGAVCKKHNLPFVEDAAQAHGAKYKGKTVGTFGAVSCFSFYPAKNLGACGEGGALVTNDAALAARAKALREHGSTVRYHHDEVGYNYRLEGIQGAVLGVKLKHLENGLADVNASPTAMPNCWRIHRCNCRPSPPATKAPGTYTQCVRRGATILRSISMRMALATRCIPDAVASAKSLCAPWS